MRAGEATARGLSHEVAGGNESTATSGGWLGLAQEVASDEADCDDVGNQTTAGISECSSTWPTTTAAAPAVRIQATANPSTSRARAWSIKKSVQRPRGRGRTADGELDVSCETCTAGGIISRVNVGRRRSRAGTPSARGAGPGRGEGPVRVKNGWAPKGATIGTTSFGSGRGNDISRAVARSPPAGFAMTREGTGGRNELGTREGTGGRNELGTREGTGGRNELGTRDGAGGRNELAAPDGTGGRTAEEEREERGSGGIAVRGTRRGDDPLPPSPARLTTRCAMRSPTT